MNNSTGQNVIGLDNKMIISFVLHKSSLCINKFHCIVLDILSTKNKICGYIFYLFYVQTLACKYTVLNLNVL